MIDTDQHHPIVVTVEGGIPREGNYFKMVATHPCGAVRYCYWHRECQQDMLDSMLDAHNLMQAMEKDRSDAALFNFVLRSMQAEGRFFGLTHSDNNSGE